MDPAEKIAIKHGWPAVVVGGGVGSLEFVWEWDTEGKRITILLSDGEETIADEGRYDVAVGRAKLWLEAMEGWSDNTVETSDPRMFDSAAFAAEVQQFRARQLLPGR